ncbi:ribonuclease III [Desulfothermus okinawensis JCM 13304]
MRKRNLNELEKIIGYNFNNKELLITALSHSSYTNENPGTGDNNERLEFLGDAVLELSISEELYERFPDAREGELTSTRAHLVNESFLARMAREIKLNEFLLLGKGEENQGGRDRDANLCDVFEALIGAVFLDGGYEKAKTIVKDLFKHKWPDSCVEVAKKDYKSKLQEITQKTFKDRPKYVLIDSFGPEHAKSYTVKVVLPNQWSFEATSTSIKKAEQLAAKKAIKTISVNK